MRGRSACTQRLEALPRPILEPVVANECIVAEQIPPVQLQDRHRPHKVAALSSSVRLVGPDAEFQTRVGSEGPCLVLPEVHLRLRKLLLDPLGVFLKVHVFVVVHEFEVVRLHVQHEGNLHAIRDPHEGVQRPLLPSSVPPQDVPICSRSAWGESRLAGQNLRVCTNSHTCHSQCEARMSCHSRHDSRYLGIMARSLK